MKLGQSVLKSSLGSWKFGETLFMSSIRENKKIPFAAKLDSTRINDIAIAMSYSSRADPGLRGAFKCLNV